MGCIFIKYKYAINNIVEATMKKLLQLVILIVGFTSLTTAQTTVNIHDLKSLTDSSGTIHLFYRTYVKYENSEYFDNNIYHYNTSTQTDSIFIRNSYYPRGLDAYSDITMDYKFLDNDPAKYVAINRYCGHECLYVIGRNDDLEGMGGFFSPLEFLNVEGTDTGRVYVRTYGETIIGRNGGKDWPDSNEFWDGNVPDSVKLGFPLFSLSPFDYTLMFGIDEGETLYRSTDRGETSEFISDTLQARNISYDADLETVYFINIIGVIDFENNCFRENTCTYELFVSHKQGEPGSWEKKAVHDELINLVPHPTEPGKLYLWSANHVLMSNDFGNHFEVLIDSEEEVTGFVAEQSGLYYTTAHVLYKFDDGHSAEILSIPVSSEYQADVPNQIKLYQNYPNPFNPSTNIRFSLPNKTHVSLIVYDMLGREVVTLVNGELPPGAQTIRFDASNLANGMYMYRLRTNEHEITRKMMLIK